LLTTNGSTASWSNAVTVSGSNATVGGTLTVNGSALTVAYASDYGFAKISGLNGGYTDFFASNGTTRNGSVGCETAGEMYLGTRVNRPIYTLVNNSVVATQTSATLTLAATTASTTTSSGALVVSGGVGVAGAIYAGGYLSTGNHARIGAQSSVVAFSANNNVDGGLPAAWTGNYGVGVQYLGSSSNAFFIGDGSGGSTYFYTRTGSANTARLTIDNTNGNLAVGGMIKGAAATYSGSPPTGVASAFQVDVENATTRDVLSFGDSSRAGLLRGTHDGSGRVIWAFGRYTGGAFAEYARIEGIASTDAKLTINGTTASTSTSSGALVVSGGVGVAGAIYAGGDITSTGSGAQEIVCESTTGANYAGVISKNNSGNTFNLYSLGSTYGGTVFGGVSGSNQAVLEGSASISSICISHANPTGKIIIAPNRTNALMVENSLVTVASGVDLKLGNAYVAGAPTAAGYIVIKDSTGTSYKIPAVAL
jgi:hypothetical protein